MYFIIIFKQETDKFEKREKKKNCQLETIKSKTSSSSSKKLESTQGSVKNQCKNPLWARITNL